MPGEALEKNYKGIKDFSRANSFKTIYFPFLEEQIA